MALTTEVLNKIILAIGVHDTPEAAGLPDTEEVRRVWDETAAEIARLREDKVVVATVGDLGPEER